LSAAAIHVLEKLQALSHSDFILPGQQVSRPLSNMAFLQVLKRMGRGDLTAHGFRSTFRDWAAEQTSYPHEVAEMALAHTVTNKVEAAYRRGDLFEKRRRLMDDWATFCGNIRSTTSSKNIIPINTDKTGTSR
jgi:integrase